VNILSQSDDLNVNQQIITIRRAIPDDVTGIGTLVNLHALKGDVLPRSIQSIYDTIDDWFVAEAGGEVLGCVSLLFYTPELYEVRSLAIQERYQGLGIGRRLMKALIEEAGRRSIPTLFALTRVVGFFERFGFTVTTKYRFPQKVWRDCQQCPLLLNCDETAVVLRLKQRS
jgi:amino-acid N-acetyltransferase